MDRKIHIAITHNDNYTKHAVVCMTSICENMKEEEIVFHILDGGLRDDSKQNILTISDTYKNTQIQFDKVDNTIFENYKKSDYYPVQMLWTTILPEIPEIKDLDRIIYLDCDLIVTNSLRPLWDMDFEDNYILAVEDANGKKYSKRYLKNGAKFFNTGLMVINCKKWQENNITSKAIKMALENTGTALGYDQTVLNILFTGKVKYLDLKYNLQYCPLNVWASYDDFDEYRKAIKEPSVIHYVGDYKPWVQGLGCYNPKQDDYLKYHKLTIYKIEDYKKWLIIDKLKFYKGLFAFIKRYPFFFLKKKFWQSKFFKI